MSDFDNVMALKTFFPLAAHEIRRGGGYGDKTQWFVYVQRQRIIDRLDELFPMQWSNCIERVLVEPQRDKKGLVYNLVTVTCSIIIDGIKREYNGSATDNPVFDGKGNERTIVTYDGENTEKSAATDAFKRAASQWGIGLYLWDCPVIQAPDENAAKRIFANWYKANCEKTQPQTEDKSVEHKSQVKTDNGIIQLDEYFPKSAKAKKVRDNESIAKVYFSGFSMADYLHDNEDDGSNLENILKYCFNQGYTFSASHVMRFVSDDETVKYVSFSCPPIDDVKLQTIRIYGREKLRDLIGSDLYNELELAELEDDNLSNTWLPLPRLVSIDYSVAVAEKSKAPYYILEDLRIEELQF